LEQPQAKYLRLFCVSRLFFIHFLLGTKGRVSVPFLLQQEVPDIAVLDPTLAHIKFIQGDNILGKVIADTVIDAKLPPDGIFRGQQVIHLDIQPVSLILTYEVNLPVTCLADGNGVAPAQELHVDDVFQQQVDILPIASDTASRIP